MRRLCVSLAVLGTAVALVGCSSSTAGQPKPASGLTQAKATAALLTVAEVSTDFTNTAPDPTKSTLPCDPKGTKSLVAQVPPTVRAEADYQNKAGNAAVEEDIYGYADKATAAKALAASEHGLNCTSGHLYNSNGSTSAVTISDPTDLRKTIAIDAGMSWQVKTPDIQGTLLSVQVGSTLLTMTFQATPAADTSTLPDTQKIVETALAKVKTAAK